MVIFGYVLLVTVILVLIGLLISAKSEIKRNQVGEMFVIKDDDQKYIFSLELDVDPIDFADNKHVSFRVRRRIAD